MAIQCNLGPLRLLSFFALAATATHFLPCDGGLLRGRTARLVILCGQHSLQVFCVGLLLSLLGHILLTSITDGIMMQLAIDIVGIALMIGVAGILTWYKKNTRARLDCAVSGQPGLPGQRNTVTTAGSSADCKTAVVPENSTRRGFARGGRISASS